MPTPLVPMLDPGTGQLGTVPADQAEEAERQGFTRVTDDEYRKAGLEKDYGGIGGMAKATGEGALRGLSFGLSDVAATQLGGEETRKAMAARKELFPVASTVGEVGGTIAPLVLSGGSGAVAKGAGVVGALPRGAAALGGLAERGAAHVVGEGATSLLGRVAQKAIPMAAAGAVEGSLYGGGQAISEAALGDEDLTAEKVLAAMGHGAIVGGVAGGALGAASAGGKYALDKLGESGSVKDFFKNFAEERTAKALGARGSDLKRLGATPAQAEARMHQMSRDVLDFKFEDGSKLLNATDTADSLAPKVTAAKQATVKRLDDVVDKIEQAGAGNAAVRPDMDTFWKRLDAEVFEPAGKSPLSSVYDRGMDVAKELDGIRTMWGQGKQFTFKELRDIRKQLDTVIYPAKGGPAPVHARELEKARGILEDVIEQSADRAANAAGDPLLASEYATQKRIYGSLREAERITGRGALQDLGNRVISPSDYGAGLTGALAGAASGRGGLGSALQGTMLGAAHKLAREHSSAILARGADALSNIKALSDAVDAKVVSGVRSVLEGGKKTAAGAATRATVEQAIPVRKVPLAAVVALPRHAAFEQSAREVAMQRNDVDYGVRRATEMVGPIDRSAPKLAARITDKHQQRLARLDATIPQAIGTKSIMPQFDKPRYAEADVHQWMRQRAIIEDPLSVFDRMHDGTITKSDVDALQATSPKLLEHIRSEFLQQMTSLKDPPSYQKKVRLSIVLGVEADETMAPQFMQMVAGAYAAAAKSDDKPQPKTRNIDLDTKQMDTTAQAVEGQ